MCLATSLLPWLIHCFNFEKVKNLRATKVWKHHSVQPMGQANSVVGDAKAACIDKYALVLQSTWPESHPLHGALQMESSLEAI